MKNSVILHNCSFNEIPGCYVGAQQSKISGKANGRISMQAQAAGGWPGVKFIGEPT